MGITVGQLKDSLDRIMIDDPQLLLPVSVLLDLPSIGPRAKSDVKSTAFGFDWDRGLLLKCEESLVIKSDLQRVWEDAQDLLWFIATKPTKKDSYEIRCAKGILTRAGNSAEKFIQYRKIFHKDLP